MILLLHTAVSIHIHLLLISNYDKFTLKI